MFNARRESWRFEGVQGQGGGYVTMVGGNSLMEVGSQDSRVDYGGKRGVSMG